MDEYMLIEVLDDFETLVLAKESGGGRTSKRSVEPGYNPTIATWIPTAIIQVELTTPNSPWPYELTNTEEGVTVKARRVTRRRSTT